jgi:DNA relaxase NicK
MKTTIDWLTFRTKAEPIEALQALKPMYGCAANLLNLKSLQRGALGFQQAAAVLLGDMPVARIDYGGESQRGWSRVAMSGKGCEWVQDWSAMQSIEDLPASEIRRLDIALTTWSGQVSHDSVVLAHTLGKFGTGGRNPDLQQITSSNPIAGKTCYIGNRKSDRFLRAYEKGYEMNAKAGGNLTHIDGHRIEDIYRTELELKASATVLPWSLIERRDEYFAGAYPFCAELLPEVDADVLQRRPDREPQTDLAAALANIKTQYGATLFTALHAYHGDMTTVWDKIIGTEHSKPLLEAGVLLVDHD